MHSGLRSAESRRGVRFEPFFSDEVILACPPGHRFAGRTVTLYELRDESLVLMQEGDERAEERDLGGVGDVDPDPHGVTLATRG